MDNREKALQVVAEQINQKVEDIQDDARFFESAFDLFKYVHTDGNDLYEGSDDLIEQMATTTAEELQGHENLAEAMVINIDWTYKTPFGYVYLTE